MSSYRVKVLGQLINLAGGVYSPLGGRIAFWLFCRTDGPEPKSEKERALFEAARPAMRQARIERLAVAGGEVAAHVFPPLIAPSGQTFLVVHGWGSRIDYLQALVTSLRQAGAVVVGLDLPGHGLSSGRTLNVLTALASIEAAWAALGPFSAVIGHSFGGFTCAMSSAGARGLTPPRQPRKLVVIGAPVAARDVFTGFSDALGLSARVRRALFERVRAISGLAIDDFSADGMLKDLTDLPALVLHAEDDKEVSADAARRYASAGPHVRLMWMNGLGHRRIVSSPDVIDAIRSFVTATS